MGKLGISIYQEKSTEEEILISYIMIPYLNKIYFKVHLINIYTFMYYICIYNL